MDMIPYVFDTSDPLRSLDIIVFNLDLMTTEKQKLLEAESFADRLQMINEYLAMELSVLKTAKKIQDKTAEELGKSAKEAFLREQIKTIEKELGIREEREEYEEMARKINTSGMSEEIKTRAFKELERLKKMPMFNPEVSYIRTYLDWIVDLPWKPVEGSKV